MKMLQCENNKIVINNESLASSNFNEIIEESLDSLEKTAESKYLLLIVNK